MIFKIIKKDFKRKKVITIAVFIFIMLSAMLISSGASMLIDLSNSLNYLFDAADVPHFVQYHTGDIDKEAIEKWTNENEMVEIHQNGEMIDIDGAKIYIGNTLESEARSVMDMGFTTQSENFDYLLNLDNEVIQVKQGEIAVPIYYMEKNDLQIGDAIRIIDKDNTFIFSVKDFVRDAQMNASIVSSKRFVVDEADYKALSELGETEYLISYKLHDEKDIAKFGDEYKSSNLPQKGPQVDKRLFKLANSITDGSIAAVIILIALLLNIIALLCIRFTIIATLEEDYKEIGIMKAIGIFQRDIRKIYMTKYFILTLAATIVGFVFSICTYHMFYSNISLYVGSAPKNVLQNVLPLFATGIVFFTIILYARMVLRRFNKITAIEAIRLGNTGETFKSTKPLALYKRKKINPNIFIGLRDVVLKFKMYTLLFVVFIVCTFIINVPLNFLNTMSSPDIVKYVGMGKSEIFIDLRQSENVQQRFDELIEYIENDTDVEKYSPLVTCQYKMINNEGYGQGLTVETGDLSIFPVDYIAGVMPLLDNEIALSYMVAEELGKGVGDEIQLKTGEDFKPMIISGVYQDITNGGRTAKANIEPNYETASWYTMYVDVSSDVSIKIDEYKRAFSEAKIVDVLDYFYQTFGYSVEYLKLLTFLAIAVAVVVAVLITSLFVQMLVVKEMSQIAIMKSLGISLKNIRTQYLTKALFVLITGIVFGTLISNILGQMLISGTFSLLGAYRVELVINPIEVYVLSPLALIALVTITTILNIKQIKRINVSDMNAE